MKTPAFWYRHRTLTAYLLTPLSLIYLVATAIRRAWVEPYRAKVPVICVGNIVAGGSGKTPVALLIARILQTSGHKPVFVTRGYGGKESGPIRVDPDRHTARDVGDEALLLARVAPVWIGVDRAAATRAAEKESTHIVLDDGMQNPTIQPHLSLLVIDGATGLGNGYMIPAGPLRETYESAMRRSTAVILIGPDDYQRLAFRVRCPLLRAHVEPELSADFPREKKFFAFAGIARPDKFYKTCRAAGLTLVGTKDFADHHFFSKGELATLKKKADALGAQLLTTEKDYVRLPLDFQRNVLTLPIKLVLEDIEPMARLLQSPSMTAPRAPS